MLASVNNWHMEACKANTKLEHERYLKPLFVYLSVCLSIHPIIT